jgi:hypothetical protein
MPLDSASFRLTASVRSRRVRFCAFRQTSVFRLAPYLDTTGNPQYSIWAYSVVLGGALGSGIARRLVSDGLGWVPGVVSLSSLPGDTVVFAGGWPRWPKAFAALIGYDPVSV